MEIHKAEKDYEVQWGAHMLPGDLPHLVEALLRDEGKFGDL